MKVGTKSVLFGAHCFFLHPWFVAWAWWKLYGFPRDPRLWVAFFVHDLGYWGKPNMDGPEGERHVLWGANFMYRWFDKKGPRPNYWYDFCLYHSRFYAKADGARHSRLCVADKLAIALTPWWLYLPMAFASGEIHEYIDRSNPNAEAPAKYSTMNVHSNNARQWYRNVQDYLRRWAEEHRDGKDDTWTPAP